MPLFTFFSVDSVDGTNELFAQYVLELRASDSLHEGSTTVVIRIKDINDLPPKFEEQSYTTTIYEEDTIGLPKSILKVSPLLPCTRSTVSSN